MFFATQNRIRDTLKLELTRVRSAARTDLIVEKKLIAFAD